MTDILETALSDFDSILKSKAFSEQQKQGLAIVALRNNLLTKKGHIEYAIGAVVEKKQFKTAVAAGLEHIGYEQTIALLSAKNEYATAARLARDYDDFATASTLYEHAGKFDRAITMALKAGLTQRAQTLYERAAAITISDLIDAVLEGDTALAANYSFQAGKISSLAQDFESAERHFGRSRRYFDIAGREDAVHDCDKILEDVRKRELVQSTQSDICDE